VQCVAIGGDQVDEVHWKSYRRQGKVPKNSERKATTIRPP
jgi:hypothetical protein